MQPTRRSYSKSFEAQVIQECAQPGASIASVALSHSLNANLVHKWIRLHTQKSTALQPALEPDSRSRIRQEKAVPVMNMLHTWMLAQRDLVPEGLSISKALDYSLKRWAALSRYLDDGAVPIDNNWAENQIRPWALGRKNWLFAGSLRSGKWAAAIMSLIQSARLNGHDPYAYLKDVLTRLPTQRASEIVQLLPHRWQSPYIHYLPARFDASTPNFTQRAISSASS